MNENNRLEDYEVSIKRVGKQIDLSILNSDEKLNDSTHADIQKIQQIFSVVLHEHCSSNSTFLYNRIFFQSPVPGNKHGYWDLGLGTALWRGFYSCLVFANGVHQLLMNLDGKYK